MSAVGLKDIKNVDIDPAGKFKYILIRVRSGNEEKHVVRGYARAEYHGKLHIHLSFNELFFK